MIEEQGKKQVEVFNSLELTKQHRKPKSTEDLFPIKVEVKIRNEADRTK